MPAMLVMCHENVLRFAAIDCSSPMSAKTERKTGSRASAAGTNSPACAISALRPAVFSATVLPPVFGPVTRSTVIGGIRRMSTGTGARAGTSPRAGRPASSSRSTTAGIRRGWRAPLSSSRPSVESDRRDARRETRQAHLGLQDVELGGRVDRLSQLDRFGPEEVRQLPENAMDFFPLLLFERDDLVVDLDGAERLEVEAGAAARTAVDDSWNRRAMLGLDDQHVAAVAVADDLVLQIARGVLTPQIGFERRPQPRPLLPQVRAQAPQFRARIVVHLAGRIDLAPHFAGLALERATVLGNRLQRRERTVRAANRGARERDRIEKFRKREQPGRLQRAAFDRQRREHGFEILRGVQRELRVRVEIFDGFGRGRHELRHAVRIGLRLKLGQTCRTKGRQREAAYDLDDAIPLECA